MTRVDRLGAFAARPAALFTSFVLVILFSYLMNAPGLSTSGAEFARLARGPVFDFRSGGYDAGQFVDALTRAGEAGRRIYLNFMALDVPFPAIYAAFWVGLFFRAVGAHTDAWRHLVLLPLVVGALDYGENLFIAIGFFTYPAPASWAVAAASVFTQVKLIATSALVLVAVALLIRWIVLAVSRRFRVAP